MTKDRKLLFNLYYRYRQARKLHNIVAINYSLHKSLVECALSRKLEAWNSLQAAKSIYYSEDNV